MSMTGADYQEAGRVLRSIRDGETGAFNSAEMRALTFAIVVLDQGPPCIDHEPWNEDTRDPDTRDR